MVATSFACTIAGSDSSGGAGVQADLAAFAAASVDGLSVITAVTAQNPTRVLATMEVPPHFVALQIHAVLEEFQIGAFKTGMLGSSGVIHVVARHLPEEVPLVVDPVMVATSGARLIESGAEEVLTRILIPRATVVTPNIPEARILAGMREIASVQDMRVAAVRILELGPDYVVVKGGHLPDGPAIDILVGDDGEWTLEGPRYPYEVHGSGCCFSASVAAFLARGCPVPEACKKAKRLTSAAIENANAGKSGRRMGNPRFGWEPGPASPHLHG